MMIIYFSECTEKSMCSYFESEVNTFRNPEIVLDFDSNLNLAEKSARKIYHYLN